MDASCLLHFSVREGRIEQLLDPRAFPYASARRRTLQSAAGKAFTFLVQLLHKRGSQPGCASAPKSVKKVGCNAGKPLSQNNIARPKIRVTMRAFQAGRA
jgi:hypothetical protein